MVVEVVVVIIVVVTAIRVVVMRLVVVPALFVETKGTMGIINVASVTGGKPDQRVLPQQ